MAPLFGPETAAPKEPAGPLVGPSEPFAWEILDAWRPVTGCLPPWRPLPGALSWAGGTVPREIFLHPSPEQDAIVAVRRADPQGSLRVLAFAGTGKTTALQLLAEADPTPGLYLAYNKGAQLEARARFPAHVACRTVHSLAFRAMGMADQLHRLEKACRPRRGRS